MTGDMGLLGRELGRARIHPVVVALSYLGSGTLGRRYTQGWPEPQHGSSTSDTEESDCTGYIGGRVAVAQMGVRWGETGDGGK